MSDYILGLDLGPNSIGWALVATSLEKGELREIGLLDTSRAGHPSLGVRIFEEGLNNFGTVKEKSLAQERRGKRSLRRVIARRRARKDMMRNVLQEAGLLPVDARALDRVVALDPYRLRAEALDRSLSREELGRAFFHLVQRRGFKSNRKSAKGTAAEGRKTLQEMSALTASIQTAGARTLGEYLYMESQRGSRPQPGKELALVHRGEVRLRGRQARSDRFSEAPRRALRSHYEQEFDAILEAQRKFAQEPLLSHPQEQRVRQALFDQRPFAISEARRAQAPSRANLHRAPQLKPCPLEPTERRARRSEWVSQRFRILKEVNNLRVIEAGWRERRPTEAERLRLVELLSEQKSVNFDRMRKELRLGEDSKFNLERGKREALDGNELDATLASALGKDRWRGLSESGRQELRDLVETSEDDTKLKKELGARGVPPKGIEKLVSLTPEDRYLAYSRKALLKLVPHLERGASEYEAITCAYPESGEARTWEFLPSLVTPELPSDIAEVTNPIVRRALGEVRKVVNAIVREHGLPRRIVVELARDMHDGPEARKEHAATLREREKLRTAAQHEIRELGKDDRPKREDIDRYLMWKEQGGMCLYTGKTIDQEALLTPHSQVEVDHILPRWASLDDSRANKILCFSQTNQEKGDRTPAEWLGTESEAYRQLLRRTEECCEHRGLPWSVLARIRQEHVEAEAFSARQLNDTRYISRLVAKYLGLLYPAEERVGQRAVLTSRGQLTAELRRQWGLNDLLDPLLDAKGNPLPDYEERAGRRVKLRVDHRHHAVDALVVALSSRSRLRRYQEFWKREQHPRSRQGSDQDGFAPPWSSFRQDAATAAAAIQVSHRVSRKIAGAFHQDTFYGQVRTARGAVLQGVYGTRKRLDELTASVVNDNSGRTGIADSALRELIIDRLRSCGWRGEDSLPKDWWRQELLMPSGVPVRRVRVRVAIGDAIRLGHRVAENAGNHHMAFDAVLRSGEPPTARVLRTIDVATESRRSHETPLRADTSTPEASFPIGRTLARNETVEVTIPTNGRTVRAVVQMLSGSRSSSTSIDLTLRDARDARPATSGNKTPLKRFKSTRALQEWQVRKIQVDPLGRAFPAGD